MGKCAGRDRATRRERGEGMKTGVCGGGLRERKEKVEIWIFMEWMYRSSYKMKEIGATICFLFIYYFLWFRL